VPRPRLLALLLLSALLLPASPALAQSSGDQQYEDPLGTEEPQQPAQSPQSPPASPEPGSQPAQSAPQSTAPQAGGGGSEQLARTGFPVGLVAAGGALLLGAGLLIRRRLS
jgi:hypothetical protein